MNCHVCGLEAIERCFTCGQLFCRRHGTVNCTRCESGYMPGDRRDRFTASPLANGARLGWWRPQEAEDYDPPACYECKGLARRRCRNCGNLHCPEHAGKGGLCRPCDRSAWAGAVMLLCLFLGFAGLFVMSYFLG